MAIFGQVFILTDKASFVMLLLSSKVINLYLNIRKEGEKTMKSAICKADFENKSTELFRIYAQTRDQKTRDQLVGMHEFLVRYWASKFVDRGEPLEDLLQVGIIGLINAIDRYDINYGFKFSTFATRTIIGKIKTYFRDMSWRFHVPRQMQEYCLTVKQAINELEQETNGQFDIRQLALKLDISEDDVHEALQAMNAFWPVSLNESFYDEESGQTFSLIDSLVDEDQLLSNLFEHDELFAAIDLLDSKCKKVIYYRYFGNLTQTKVGQKMSISQMQVSRLERSALIKLQDILATNELRKIICARD
ncbi:MAG: sigma-70 family RNA polymerase sigma factor [Patescibacteria group bacterium]|nr:sigma-70 family RNA polymerase sigma factor [Patescibacteria group bacterium]